MRYLIVLLLFLTACGPSDFRKWVGIRKFAVGDCLIQSINRAEKWDKADYKVIDIGKDSYLIEHIRMGYTTTISFGHLFEDYYQKVSCPKDDK